MEDEDGGRKLIDMWSMLEEQQLRDTALSNSLKHSIDSTYVNAFEEGRQQLIRYGPILTRDQAPAGKNTVTAGPRLTFKGYKKRILAQAREIHTAVPRNNAAQLELPQQQLMHPNARAGGKDRRAAEGKRGERKITEYAQYLGLQPSARYKCAKCHVWLNGPNSKNSCGCASSSMTPMPSTSESGSASMPHASNFKITRKVYLCSACGTYFENWNLFLHMRDIHKRHICLFCLGMFGQAERLSYHLLKKHSVPEMAFSSVDDFYGVFKGSCYLVCCSCEKVFSETDNFYNHYCVPALKEDTADTVSASTCTLCRQTGTHAATCNFALLTDADKESYDATAPLTVADATRDTDVDMSPAAVPPTERATNLGGKGLPRKTLKLNRTFKPGADFAVQNRRQKSNAFARNLDTRARCDETQPGCDNDAQREIANNLPRDTVTETIMEVSRYMAGMSNENDENDEQLVNKDVPNPDRGLGDPDNSPAHNHQLDRNEPYDSVTETIMEVSRYTGEEDKSERDDSTSTTRSMSDLHALSHVTEKMNIKEVHDKSDICATRATTSRAPSPLQWEANENAANDTKANVTTCESGKEFESQSCGSSQDVQSPSSSINRSLFSPQHELHSSESQSNERECYEEEEEEEKEEEEEEEEEKKEEEKKPVVTNAAESQASVSFNTVAPSERSSDRSLVIKICNRNSRFSVATATTVTTVNRESEENNNADRSVSKEKMSNGSGGDMDIVGSDQANELDDSDSDSDKLAMVDSNPEEDEEAEDGDETEETEKTADEGRREYSNHETQEENNGTEIGTGTDAASFTIGGTIPDDQVEAERPDDNEGTIDETKTDSITNDQARNCTVGDDGIPLAGEDVPCVDLNVEGTLDSMELDDLLKRCIETASPTCVYCNHARYIAVNGKQLGLHMLAEHRFQPQHPAIIIHMEQFVMRVKRSLDDLESHYFNLNTYDNTRGTYHVPDVLIYECFHCRFYSAVHKELYLHNRKMHQKTILICIMCKSTFYSYSELLCHLCPGIYSPNVNLRYRCCLCSVNSLPSAFRLMVHLRKRHHACDVCLESTGNQQRLSNHVWKHKLHHLCYRCGIAYRNKPDITKHLFWKHGTESVLCRKCLQKKWPHIYHFCIPPTAFVCEECGSSFGRAVALKVHKRLHSGDLPYSCDECAERFISRKLLGKHQTSHREPEPELEDINITDVITSPLIGATDRDEKSDNDRTTLTIEGSGITTGTAVEAASRDVVKETVKKVVDVYDLPPLNLSSESDTDSEEEKVSSEKLSEKDKVGEEDKAKSENGGEGETVTLDNDNNDNDEDDDNNGVDGDDQVDGDVAAITNDDIVEVERNEEEKKQEARIMDGIWDNFKTYAASLDVEESAKNVALKESVPETDAAYLRSIVLADHDYHVIYSDKTSEDQTTTTRNSDAKRKREEHGVEKSGKRSPSSDSPARNAAGQCDDNDVNKRKAKSPKKKKRSASASSTSDSSSDTDSSSCSCGTNCSCSSSSSGSSSSSSSSSDSDSSTSESSPRKQSTGRKERNKKEREAARENKSQSVESIAAESKEITVENGLVAAEMETSEPPVPPAKPLLRESDLETEETETDEDFYDEYPQLLANKLLAEKRNLLLLAAVAPASTPAAEPAPVLPPPTPLPLNNGVLDAETMLPEPIAAQVTAKEQQQQQKRKTKTKKRRKTERSGGRRNANIITTTSTTESIKLNIPKAFYQRNPGFAASSPVALQSPPVRSSTPVSLPAARYNDHHHGVGDANGGAVPEMTRQQASSITSSTVESENKRVSKRKRVPKRFYGDSSDDEPQEKQMFFGRWRRTTETTVVASIVPATIAPPTTTTTMTMTMTMTPSPSPSPSPLLVNPKPVAPSRLSLSDKNTTPAYTRPDVQITEQLSVDQKPTPTMIEDASTIPVTAAAAPPASPTESEDAVDSSSDNSESEVEDTVANQSRTEHNNVPPVATPTTTTTMTTTMMAATTTMMAATTTMMAATTTMMVATTTTVAAAATTSGPVSATAPATDRPVKIYCYCQCPYDEVSEMIACDGEDCRIEWFHFECVGIMVPPKGKWYCPDCRRKHGIVQNSDEYCD